MTMVGGHAGMAGNEEHGIAFISNQDVSLVGLWSMEAEASRHMA